MFGMIIAPVVSESRVVSPVTLNKIFIAHSRLCVDDARRDTEKHERIINTKHEVPRSFYYPCSPVDVVPIWASQVDLISSTTSRLQAFARPSPYFSASVVEA